MYINIKIKNYKFFLFIYFLFHHCLLFSQESKEIQNLNEINNKIYSNNVKDRITAIKKLQTYIDKSEEAYNLLLEKLLTEINIQVLHTILNIFEKRKKKKDFFYLVEFLKISQKEQHSIRILKLLYSMNDALLRKALTNFFIDKHRKIYSLLFLKAIQKPKKVDLQWFIYIFHKFKISQYWLTLNHNYDTIIISFFKPYYSKNFFLKKLSSHSFYWHIIYYHYYNIPLKENIISQVNHVILEKIPKQRVYLLLNIISPILTLYINPLTLISLKNKWIHIWLIEYYVNNNTNLNQKIKWDDAILKLIHSSYKVQVYLRLFLNINTLPTSFKDAIDTRCKEFTKIAALCFEFFKEKGSKKLQEYLNIFKKKTVVLSNILFIHLKYIIQENIIEKQVLLNLIQKSSNTDLKNRYDLLQNKVLYEN